MNQGGVGMVRCPGIVAVHFKTCFDVFVAETGMVPPKFGGAQMVPMMAGPVLPLSHSWLWNLFG